MSDFTELMKEYHVQNWQVLAMLTLLFMMLAWVLIVKSDAEKLSTDFNELALSHAGKLCEFKKELLYSQQPPSALVNWTVKNRTSDVVSD